MAKFKKLGKKVGQLVDEKQVKYGNSFGSTQKFLELFFPDGITPDQYGTLGFLFRTYDKLCRLTTSGGQAEVCPHCGSGESPCRDIVGYALLELGKYEE